MAMSLNSLQRFGRLQIALSYFQSDCLSGTDIVLRLKTAQEHNFEETDDQLAEFLRIFIENLEVCPGKKECSVAGNLKLVRVSYVTSAGHLGVVLVWPPEVTAPPNKLAYRVKNLWP